MKRGICFLISLVMALSLFCSCSNSSRDVVVTVGEEIITEGELSYVIANMVEGTKKQFLAMSLTEEQKKEQWQTDIDGKKPSELIKEYALSEVINYAIFAQAAKDENLSVTSSEVNTQLSKVFTESDFDLFKKTYGVSKNAIKEILRKQMLKEKYITRFLSKQEAYTPNNEQLMEIFENDYLKAQHILIGITDEKTGELLSEEEITKKESEAQNLLRQAKSGADFSQLAQNYSDDPGKNTYPQGYVFTEGEMVTEFYEGAKALKENEISGIVRTSYGFHIIKRLPLLESDIDEKLSTITTAYQNDFITSKSEELKSKYEVSQNDALISKIPVNTGF